MGRKHARTIHKTRPQTPSEAGSSERGLSSFERRTRANASRARVNNATLTAGSPMHYYCRLCGEEMTLPESHSDSAPTVCRLCASEGRHTADDHVYGG